MLLVGACEKTETRGRSTPSKDGRTYLVIVESPGCAAFRIDGVPWAYPMGVPGVVAPGRREITCSDESNRIGFEVTPGTTFHFDYWGP